jgi:hypothetical protein
MKRASLVILMALLLSAGSLLAQSRAEKPNDFTIELGGKAILYSLSYQRMVGEMFGLEIGASFIGGAIDEGGGGIIFLSGGGRFYFIKKNASPTLSAGLVYVTAATDAGPIEGSGVYFYVNPGFEFRQSSGFVVRGGVYFLIKDGFFVWPGIQLGIAF